MDYVTDTHSIVWYFTEDIHLSKKALDIFEGTIKEGTIIVPGVVLGEIMFIAKKGKISLTFTETLNKIEEYENFEIAPLDIDVLKIADKIKANIEMHDRLIIATAIYCDATLITKDEKSEKSGIFSTIW